MSESIKIVPEKIQLTSIRILGGHITADPSIDPNNVVGYNVQYGIKDEFYLQTKSFKFILTVFINALDEKDQQLDAKGEYNIEYVFVVENLEYYIENKNEPKNRVILHNVLLHTLLSIVYSTSRGIILSRTQGTSLDGVILPVIDTNLLLKQLDERNKQLQLSENEPKQLL